MDVQLEEFGPDDADAVERYVAQVDARHGDAPWMHRTTARQVALELRHGWDGEPGRRFVVTADGEDVGTALLNTSDYDNLDFAFVGAFVHPDRRRQGIGTAAYEQVVELARAMGRTNLGTEGWDHDSTRAFAAARGWAQKSVAVARRQHLAELEPGLADRLHAEALPHAAAYELVRIEGRSPAELLEPLAVATAAINDAPLDDLEMEDEVFTGERIAAYEAAQMGRGYRLYRIVARHRETGEIAGLTVTAVDSEDPTAGFQHDTSVVGAHRGHRLGVLLKTDMMRWLAEREPRLQTVDTWNMESNDHMVGINERLGYRVMGRELQFQRRL